jgi:hypothetical protein
MKTEDPARPEADTGPRVPIPNQGSQQLRTDPGNQISSTRSMQPHGLQAPAKPVERMFPFVLRARILLVGRETLRRSKGKLHFVLVTEDLSESSRAEVLKDFAHYPVVQRYTSAEVEQFFRLKGTKVVGFTKSGLAQSIYAELKQHRLNKPPVKPKV